MTKSRVHSCPTCRQPISPDSYSGIATCRHCRTETRVRRVQPEMSLGTYAMWSAAPALVAGGLFLILVGSALGAVTVVILILIGTMLAVRFPD